MEFLDFPVRKTLADIGLDQFGQSPLQFFGSEINFKAQTMGEAGLPSNFIQDGETIIRLTVVDGYLQSTNYVEGVSGWRLGSNDSIDANNGNFRGDLTGANGTFTKTLYVGDSKIEIDGEGDTYGYKVKDGSGNVLIFMGIEP